MRKSRSPTKKARVGNFTCPFCHAVFTNERGMRQHMYGVPPACTQLPKHGGTCGPCQLKTNRSPSSFGRLVAQKEPKKRSKAAKRSPIRNRRRSPSPSVFFIPSDVSLSSQDTSSPSTDLSSVSTGSSSPYVANLMRRIHPGWNHDQGLVYQKALEDAKNQERLRSLMGYSSSSQSSSQYASQSR